MIQLSHLACGYDRKTILANLNITFEAGSFSALVGPNGCGKSTLLRTLAGLQPALSGQITISNKASEKYSRRQLAQTLSFVQQKVPADLDFTAFETALMGRNPYQRRLQNESQADLDIVEQSMRKTHCWELRDSRFSQLSGGEQQRVMIARALAQQTPVMLLDEPIANLDIAHQFEILQLLSDLNQSQHSTILLVIHDLNLAYQYCRQILILHQGSAVYQGPIEQGLTPQCIREVFGVSATLKEQSLQLSALR